MPDDSAASTSDPFAVVRTRGYLVLLGLAAIVGAPISFVAYWFLKLISVLNTNFFNDLPKALGFHGEPIWWPLPLVTLAGILVGLTIRYLPGTAGHIPAEGFKATGPPAPIELPSVVMAALATLALGVVLGPEAPLIAIGGGLGAIAVRLAKRDAPPTTAVVIASAGSFAAISTLFGSPIASAFLLMEASGLGGPMLGIVLVPGLLASGIGTLIFIGLDSWTGYGTFSLGVQGLPHVGSPTGSEFGWALVIGLAAALLGTAIYRVARLLRSVVEPRMVLLTPVVGLAVAGLAIAFAEGTGRSSSEVLFSGQTALGPLLVNGTSWSVGALCLLVACKAIAYGGSLSSFRGGPTFPGLFIGAAGGLALSHLPGLSMLPAAGMGMGAMCAVMLGLPLTSVLVATLFLGADGITIMPLVIVAVVVAYVARTRLTAAPTSPNGQASQPPAPDKDRPMERGVAGPAEAVTSETDRPAA